MSEAAALVFSGVVLGGVVAMLLLIRASHEARFKPYERLVDWHDQMDANRVVSVYNYALGPVPCPEQEAGWVEWIPKRATQLLSDEDLQHYGRPDHYWIDLRLTDKAIGVVETVKAIRASQTIQPITKNPQRLVPQAE